MNAQISERALTLPGVALVSGWSFPADMWRALADDLADHSVTLLSWYELGRWLMANGPLTPTLETALQQPIWVGWSLGGTLLAEALARGEVRSERALIVAAMPRLLEDDGWPGITSAGMRRLRRQVARSPIEALKGFDDWLGLDVEIERHQDARMLDQGLEWLSVIDRRAALDQMPGRVDWLGGLADPLVRSAWYGRVPEEVGRSLLIKGGGHGLPFTHPDLIREWIENGRFGSAS